MTEIKEMNRTEGKGRGHSGVVPVSIRSAITNGWSLEVTLGWSLD